MRIVLVFHGLPKASFPSELAEVTSNPTLGFEGMLNVHRLVPVLRALGPFDALFSSRMARALDTASVLSMAFDLEISTIRGLGQHANKEGDMVVKYPGREHEDFSTWQRDGVAALATIFYECHLDEVAIAVSHRPGIAGIVGAAQGITDPEKIKALADDPEFVARGFCVLNVEEVSLGEFEFRVVESGS